MKQMTLEQILERINTIVDNILVTIAGKSESRFLFTLPALVDNQPNEVLIDCQETGFGIARLREVITYKYLLSALKSKLLELNYDNLVSCLKNMRLSPVIDYYDLADYHEFAYYYYKKLGNERKANIHLLSCYFDRGRAILSCDKVFDCKELLLVILKDRQRLLTFLLYVLDFVGHEFEDYQEDLKRSQYLLIERSLVLAEKVFAEDTKSPLDLRCSIYYVQSLYYNLTKRPDMALKAKRACRQLGGKQSYRKLFEDFSLTQQAPHFMDLRFLDYMLYVCSLEDDDICSLDENGNITFEIDDEYSIWEKDERNNFLDAYYRPVKSALEFKIIYERAEKGEKEAIQEVSRRFRDGDGVAACECAADAWTHLLTH